MKTSSPKSRSLNIEEEKTKVKRIFENFEFFTYWLMAATTTLYVGLLIVL